MKNREQHSFDTTADRAYTMHCSSGIVTLVATCLITILTLCPSVHSRNDLRCGDEVRLVSQTGEVLQGRLTNAAADSLEVKVWRGKPEFRTVQFNDIANLYRVKRKTGPGIVSGVVVGTLIGALAAAVICSAEAEPDGFEAIGRACRTLAMTGGGALLGGVMGGIIGHNTQTLGEVQLEATPMCMSTMGEIEPVGVTFAVNF
ncbi:MAG: hypothetical protein JSU65_09505 [Candidatus Zixiibacteriota bacterium]|nr:MAG: hypothetical protein JSU65_09505 [candidate division Zixibacteria bacterium]